jgi:hypothetical protein
MPVPSGKIGYWIFIPRALELGWSQRQFFEWARSKEGVWTQRDSTMRAVWHRLDAETGYRYAMGQLRDDQLVPKSYMSPLFYEGRRSQYTYTVAFTVPDRETGRPTTLTTTVRSEEMLRKGEAIELAKSNVIRTERTAEEASSWRLWRVEDADLGWIGEE